jgi:hypothetical protein
MLIMDPDLNLREQRELAARIVADYERRFDGPRPEDARRLAQLVQALDEHITRGGALPRHWVPDRLNRS